VRSNTPLVSTFFAYWFFSRFRFWALDRNEIQKKRCFFCHLFNKKMQHCGVLKIYLSRNGAVCFVRARITKRIWKIWRFYQKRRFFLLGIPVLRKFLGPVCTLRNWLLSAAKPKPSIWFRSSRTHQSLFFLGKSALANSPQLNLVFVSAEHSVCFFVLYKCLRRHQWLLGCACWQVIIYISGGPKYRQGKSRPPSRLKLGGYKKKAGWSQKKSTNFLKILK